MSRSEVGISWARCHSQSLGVFLLQIVLFLIFRSKLWNRIRNSNYNKVQFSEHFISLIFVCDVLCVITLVMAPRNDPSQDGPSLFKGGISQLVLEHYGCNTLRTTIFSKTWELLKSPYKDHSSLNRW
jgi:anaerobic C4-dicarboxylate transporter